MSDQELLSDLLSKKVDSISFGGTTGTRRKRRYKRRSTTIPRRTYGRRYELKSLSM
jgi:hypothetical protein